MTKVRFSVHDGLIDGFKIIGHSSFSSDDEEGRLVCSAVSSVAFFVANTVTDVVGADAAVNVNDGEMYLKINSRLSECQTVLKGMILHMRDLASQYDNRIRVYSEV